MRHGAVIDHLWLWVAFNAFVLAVLALDLGVFHRRAHAIRVREAAAWVTVWASLAVAFGFGVLHYRGTQVGLEFFAGYLVEQALSVDNIFVFVLIFSYFQVPAKYQHRVLFWGILSALVMRGIMIAAGAYLLHRFHWITFVFGAFLVVTGVRMATQREAAIRPEANPVIRLIRRFVPITKRYHGQRFFVWRGRVRAATPLFVVLVLLETTDLIFAVDSIPAVFGVTRDPFIVYTSNVFAILGLRSLYFLLAGVIERFHYLKLGLSVVLAFVGVKMLLADVYPIPIAQSLGVIAGVLAVAVAGSLLFPQRTEPHPTRRDRYHSWSGQNPRHVPHNVTGDLTAGLLGRPRSSSVTRGCGALAGLVLAVLVIGLGLRWATLPDASQLADANPETTAFIERYRERRAANPELPPLRHEWVPSSEISVHVKRAVVSAEDLEFFQHEGFSAAELQSAMRDALAGEEMRGASTITQQLAKNLWLSPSRNPLRKLKEAILTRRLERALSKQRILELYVNVAEFGPGIYGVGAAARHYFGKPAAQLTKWEAATLAAALPRPSAWHPGVESEAYQRYVEEILRRMERAEFLWKYVDGPRPFEIELPLVDSVRSLPRPQLPP